MNTQAAAELPSKKLSIGLLWHSFMSENLGVGALTVSNMDLIGKAAVAAGFDPVFEIIGIKGQADYSHVSTFPCRFTNIGFKALLNPLSGLHQAIKRCDILFDIGGGDSFSDIYGWRRFSLILASKWAAIIRRKTLVFSPQTIGPFSGRIARILAKQTMRRAAQIFVRDELSLRAVEKLSLPKPARLTTDVAFAMPWNTAPAFSPSGKRHVGINVSALLYRRDIETGDKISLSVDYPELIDTILSGLVSDPANIVHLVPHVLAEHTAYEDDYAVSEQIREKFPNVLLAPRFASPTEAKSYISGLDLLIGSRMHATIAGLSSGTPIFALSYSRKFTGLFGSIGYRWVADMTQASAMDIIAQFETLMRDLTLAKQETENARSDAHEKLSVYNHALTEIFTRLAKKANSNA